MLPRSKLVNKLFGSFRLQFSVLFVFLAMIGAFMITAPVVFLSPRTYTSVMVVAPFYIILAIGETFILIAGEVDMSFPSIVGFAAYAFAWIWSVTGNIPLSILAAFASGAALGLINGVLITGVNAPSLVITLGTYYFWRGVITVLTNGLGIQLNLLGGTLVWKVFVGMIGGGLPTQVIWATLVAVGAWVLMNRSKIGAHIYAVGDNRDAARVMGIDVRKTLVFIFTLSGVLAALTGIMINLVDLTLWPTSGDSYLLPALASAFIGGNPLTGGSGTIFGSVIGGLILSFITLGIVVSGGTGFWTQLIYGLIIVVAISTYSVVKRSKRITEVLRRPISSM